MDLDLTPFGVRPSGYFQYEDASGAHQITGALVTTKQMQAKIKLMKDGRRNTRRQERWGNTLRARQFMQAKESKSEPPATVSN